MAATSFYFLLTCSLVWLGTATDLAAVSDPSRLGYGHESLIEGSVCENSKMISSRIYGSYILGGSKVVNSDVRNSRLTNCLVVRSTVEGKAYDSVTIIDGNFYRNEVKAGGSPTTDPTDFY